MEIICAYKIKEVLNHLIYINEFKLKNGKDENCKEEVISSINIELNTKGLKHINIKKIIKRIKYKENKLYILNFYKNIYNDIYLQLSDTKKTDFLLNLILENLINKKKLKINYRLDKIVNEIINKIEFLIIKEEFNIKENIKLLKSIILEEIKKNKKNINIRGK